MKSLARLGDNELARVSPAKMSSTEAVTLSVDAVDASVLRTGELSSAVMSSRLGQGADRTR